MTWITVHHACGHTHWKDIHGMELHRRRVLAAAQSSACSSCRASLSRSVSEQEGLPLLQGSDRQIAWAHPIRTEAMAQAGGVLIWESIAPEERNFILYLTGIEKSRFKRPAHPGDQILLTVDLVARRQNLWRFNAKAEVNGDLIASAEFLQAPGKSL